MELEKEMTAPVVSVGADTEGRLLTGRFPEGGKEFPDGPACLSGQHRPASVGL